MHHIYKQKHVGVASVLPLVMLLANSHMWTMYGYLSENWFPIFSCFVIGDFAALAYIAVYWWYSTDPSYVGHVFTAVVATLAIITIYAIIGGLGYTGQTRPAVASLVGYIGDVTAILLYASPMEKLFQVLKHKSAAFINVHMVIASLTNNWMWFTYGILTDNWIILAPNMFFVTLNSFTLVLYIVFNPKTHPLSDSFLITNDGNDVPVEVTVEMSPKATIGTKQKLE
ncbi:hypothetical protein BBJ29_009638 [Phytophthora kernoviae]|uniref:MtN3-like protein n=1 Tax=Phytophthora kernoviae TaxID=325452 RepID=A0A3F2RKP3_9STRA|nr:hypothetical protein BBJ29_009638 [Phytophthora kernoviae]RLN58824.1 hypothetical protein BBP00_00006803 [Phytophthora kernoviae]